MTADIHTILIESEITAQNDIVAGLKSLDVDIGKFSATANFQEGVKLIQPGVRQIVFLEVTKVEQGVKETAILASRFPHTPVIVTAAEKNPDWILPLIRAGASEYLTKPIVAAELKDAIQKVTRLHLTNNESVLNKGTVISVYNPSGGMGATTIAVNLAASLAIRGENVVLIDLNLCNGDVTAFLDLAPRYTLSSVISRRGHVDASFLRSVIVPHSTGLHVLCAPTDLIETDKIRPEHIQELIAVLQSMFAYTIIDTGGQLFGCNLATFECSDRILFVTLLNLPALKNAKRYLAVMKNEGLGFRKLKLILNRYIPKDDIKLDDAENILNTKAYLKVPNAYQDVKTSVNTGLPLITCCPRSSIARAIEELSRQITLDLISKNTSALAR